MEEVFERIKILMKYNCTPYIMRYKDYEKSPFRGMYINLARWCNQVHIFKKMSFREFCIEIEKRSSKNCSTIRYMNEFKKQCPDIANKYLDMK